MKTVVLGTGGWGTALALVLHDNGHDVTLWSHTPEKAAQMTKTRENPLLKGVLRCSDHRGKSPSIPAA